MSSANKLLQAASGNAGDKVYVEDVYSTFLYAGNDSTNQIQNGLDLSGEGGMVWIKSRSSGAMNHKIMDTERGVNKNLTVNYNYGQDTDASINSFNSDGFTLNTTYSDFNDTGHDYVAWSWRKQPGFFDVVTYTGDGTSSRDIAHSLGSKPGFIITKRTNLAGNWTCYHQSLGYQERIYLDLTNAKSTNSATWVQEPTATHFTVGSENSSGSTYVAYLFAHDDQSFGDDSDEAIIKCGSYTTDSSGNATVDLGFEPQWVLDKTSAYTANWTIVDFMRGFDTRQSNGYDQAAMLHPNSSNAESLSGGKARVTSTGFTVSGTTASQTFIYVAIRRPMKTPAYGTDVYTATTGSSSGAFTHSTNFRVDLNITTNTTSGSNRYISDRNRGSRRLFTDTTDAEASLGINWDRMTGWQHTSTGDYSAWTGWNFKRATGFLDIIRYSGNNQAGRQITHNLKAIPKMIWIKNLAAGEPWYVYHVGADSSAPEDYHILLNGNAASSNSTEMLNDTAPTASVFSVSQYNAVNGLNKNYIAYLFGEIAGVTKLSNYTGTGSTINVDCGFSSGARFVFIKRTDDNGNWFLYDSHRGISAGADPYILLNTNSAQDSSNDDIDPLSSGFSIPSGSNVNTNGANYIFLAIA